jgi:hypothetical protein
MGAANVLGGRVETGGFTVKEMIVSLSGKVDAVLLSLNAKADRDEVRRLDERVQALERKDAGDVALSTFQRWAVGGLLSALVAILIALLTLVVGH